MIYKQTKLAQNRFSNMLDFKYNIPVRIYDIIQILSKQY